MSPAPSSPNGTQLVENEPAADLMTDGDYRDDGDYHETGARGYFPGIERLADVLTANWAYWRYAPVGSFAFGRPVRGILPPIMGGSPYASPDTGWHAEGCLCRRCSL